MCRMFALFSARPTPIEASLWSSPTSLACQSGCDRRGEKHEHGWGLAWFGEGRRGIEKSVRPCQQDEAFRQRAATLEERIVVAHVRQASVGCTSLENTHPFVHSPWMFVHNGTLQEFAAGRDALLAQIPMDLRAHIQGQTDSEHAFYFWLGLLRARAGSLEQPTIDDVCRSLCDAVDRLAQLFPDTGEESTKMNFLLTDGRLLAATRRGHSLVWLQRGRDSQAEDRMVMIASEPTTAEPWQEVAENTALVVDQQLEMHWQKF